MSKDFLVELGTEELPPKALIKLLSAFKNAIKSSIEKEGLEFSNIESYASPRRMAVIVKDLAELTPTKEVVAWGPPAKIAFDAEGKPSKAANAFAQKNGISVDELKVENDGKADKLCHRANSGGVDSKTLFEDFVNLALATLPIPKRMRW